MLARRHRLAVAPVHRIARLAAALSLVLAMGACVSVRSTFTPAGHSGYAITCGHWRGCLVKAGRLCGVHGYDVTLQDPIDGLLVVSCGAEALTGAQRP